MGDAAPGSRLRTAATAPFIDPFTAVAAEESVDGCLLAVRGGVLRRDVRAALLRDALLRDPPLRAVLRDAAPRAALRRLAAFATPRFAVDRRVFFAAVLRRDAFFATLPPLATVRARVLSCRAAY